MSQQIVKIKQRIQSISNSLKVTNAMKLVSTVKLKKWKNKMMANREYTNRIFNVIDDVLKCQNKYHSPYSVLNENTTKKLYIIVTSSLGLCGSYNNNIFKLCESAVSSEDDLVVLGKKGIAHFDINHFHVLSGYDEYNGINSSKIINQLINYISSEYIKKTYREVRLICSEYKNSMVFIPKDFVILPFISSIEESIHQNDLILEPSPKELIDELMNIYVTNSVFSRLLESEVCEHASRTNAMENATENANELLDDLNIEFNKARQASITQEITEIVASSERIGDK